jgi:hypothetical protein
MSPHAVAETMRAVLLASGLLLALLPLAASDSHGDCTSKGWPALGVMDFGGYVYFDDRNYLLGNGWWWYLESNGAPGLQRGGSSPVTPDDNEICYDDSDVGPDTLMW